MSKFLIIIGVLLVMSAGFAYKEGWIDIKNILPERQSKTEKSSSEENRAANLELDTKIKVYIRTMQIELMDYKQKNGAYPASLPSTPPSLLSSFPLTKERLGLEKHFQYRSLQNGASYEITAELTTGKITYTPSSLAH